MKEKNNAVVKSRIQPMGAVKTMQALLSFVVRPNLYHHNWVIPYESTDGFLTKKVIFFFKYFSNNVLFFFKSKVLLLLSQVKITLNIYIFMLLNDILVVLKPFILLGVFHYFGHHCRPASQIFNLRLSFDYFNPAIILIKKKLRFGRFKIWFGTEAAKIGDFAHLNFTFGH